MEEGHRHAWRMCQKMGRRQRLCVVEMPMHWAAMRIVYRCKSIRENWCEAVFQLADRALDIRPGPTLGHVPVPLFFFE